MNQLKIFDQTFTDKKNFVFLILFELLINPEFEEMMPIEYNKLLSEFNQNIKYNSFSKLDLNIVLNHENKASFIKIFESINSNRFKLTSSDLNQVIKSKLFLNQDYRRLGSIIYKELDNKIYVTDLFNTILNGLKFETFYELSIVDANELLDEWVSIRESGQLRINYNMTDWTPIGSKIELKIEKFNVDFYKFICLATVRNYNSEESFLINVYETNVQIKDGFFYHFHFQTNAFLYKKPIYEFENDTFKTIIADYEFVFKRKNKN
ncbi:hypothetical protein [Flavobacterium denitrificans]|uniref:hypothetical protein n=1 Tax=Flavobacterium denitrificans TaxID=281361 RepID=UPI00041CA263|nr:hypothetical protein [Flavobacterium denitrificans]